jgi:hypothetical protein
MSIAILGWGSLIPDPRGLPKEGEWRQGGPTLPIEFSRISQLGEREGCLTLVIDERNGTPVPTFYATSTRIDLDLAIADLQAAERTPDRHNIGFCDLAGVHESARARDRHPRALVTIRRWAAENRFDAVIWTALGPRFRDGPARVPFSPEEALRYLDGLPDPVKARALAYIHSAPDTTMTRFRRLLLASEQRRANQHPPHPPE